MKNLTLFLFFLLSSLSSFSQYIEGRVFDAITKKPIEGVHVYMEGINRGTLTNEKGTYFLKFPHTIVKSDVIHFTHIAYKPIEVPYLQNKKSYSVYLFSDLKKLEEVKIAQRRNLKKSISYKKLSSMKKGLYSFGSLLKEDKIYVIGGDASYLTNGHKQTLQELENNLEVDNIYKFLTKAKTNYFTQFYKKDILIYDIKLNKWEKKENLNFRKRAYHNLNLYNNKIYILGGKRLSISKKYEYLDDKIEVFDLDTENIFTDNTNPHQAVDFASFTYKDNIIVMGGSIKMKRNGFKEYSNKVHLYNLKVGKWYLLGNMPVAKEVNGVLIENKIYLIGGTNRKPFSSIETFDLVTQKWKKEGSLFYGIAKPAVTHSNHIIYFYDDGKITTYNINTKELNEYLIDLNLKRSELYYSNNKLYLLGGIKKNDYSYKPSGDLFSIDISDFDKTKIHNSKTL